MRLLVFLTILGVSACQQSSGDREPPVNSQADGPVQFTANPQRLDEVPVSTLPLGAAAPDFRLPEAEGGYVSLADFKDAELLLIVFTCNHCPTAQAYEDRLIALANDYKRKGVEVIAISPNSPIGLLYEELGYTDLNDDYDQMAIRKRDKKFPFPYLYDGDDQAVSIKYGAVATPHAYVFDKDRKLRYIGRFDNQENPGLGANAEDVRAALDALLAGQEVALASTKTFGCSVKWSWKDEYKKKVDREWKETPVTLQDIDEDGIRTLLKNDSEKLRLINVWATWCGPCILEYPEFVAIHRMYKGRDFEFISISADKLSHKEKARSKLQELQSAVSNYIFTGADKYALIEAIDPNWNGALPYTLMVEPGGKIVYSKQGSLDNPLELKKAIVDHPMIGRYY